LIPASSSVGLAAIQLANYAGATPIALTRASEKKQPLLDAGAAHVIATSEANLVAEVTRITEGKGARVAFDPVGGETFAKRISALSFQGVLYLYGALADAPTTVPVLEMIAKMLVIKGHNIWLTSGDDTRRKAAVEYITKGLEADALRQIIAHVRRNGRGPSLSRAEWPVRQDRCHCLTRSLAFRDPRSARSPLLAA
jgi:NADPH:quinone reductase-like Zn-dependent oxidoreductase